MITKDQFKKIMDAIQKEDNIATKFSEALQLANNDNYFISFGNNMTDLVLDILHDQFNDTDDWINWWIYEKDMGARSDLNAQYKDGTKIKLDTPDELYDFLVENMKK